MISLRDYQTALVDGVGEAWEGGHRAVLATLACGGGKTEIAASIALDVVGRGMGRVVIASDRKGLAHQWGDRFSRHGYHDWGLIQADNTRREWASIVCGTIHSIATRGAGENVALVIVDETHIWYEHHNDLLAAYPGARVLGLTATPGRAGLGRIYSHMIHGPTIRELTERGWLVPARTFSPKGDEIARALDTLHLQGGDYNGRELGELMRARAVIGDVVSTWQRFGEDRQTIAFCVDKQHARDLAAEFNAAGVPAAFIFDKTDVAERGELFAAFDAGRLRVLCSVGVLAVGFDSPVASCAILARPTLSEMLHVQQGARVLRLFEGKADALVLDHAANTLRHGLLLDYVPPASLSLVDASTDKRKRREPMQAWICPGCEAVNPPYVAMCDECGHPRYRRTVAVIVDGELTELPDIPGEKKPGPTVPEIQDGYLQLTWYAAHKGFRNPHGWAWHKSIERYRLDPSDKALLARVLPWRLREEKPRPPDAECERWLKADLIRYLRGSQGSQAPTNRR